MTKKNPQDLLKESLCNINASIKSISDLITQFTLEGEQKAACEMLSKTLHDEYERHIVNGELGCALTHLYQLKASCRTATDKARKSFEDTNPDFFYRYIKPIINNILDVINHLVALFSPNKKQTFKLYQTKTDALDSIWNAVRDELNVAIVSATRMNLR